MMNTPESIHAQLCADQPTVFGMLVENSLDRLISENLDDVILDVGVKLFGKA